MFFTSYIGNFNLEISSSVGNGTGLITFPEPAAITSHKNNDTINSKQPLVIVWTGNAMYYWLQIDFYSTSNNRLSLDTIAMENKFELIPSHYADTYGLESMGISVIGCNGPDLTPGAIGNMHGDGQGFLYAANLSNVSKRSISLQCIGSAGLSENTANKNFANSAEKKERFLKGFNSFVLLAMEHSK
jgi:hypothetical protein